MTPDYEKAATKALEMLVKHNINTAPIMPLPVFKRTPGVLVLSFAEMSSSIGMDRADIVNAFETEQHDAVTSVHNVNGKLHYLVAYNQRLPLYIVQRALARELGHIVLGHDGSRPEDVRMAEAYCFAHHFLCPRPLIRAVQDAGIPLTVEVLGNMTGCYERCLIGMRKTPGVRVSPDLNRAIREQFSDYIENFIDFQRYLSKSDESMLANFGTYMDGYEE